MKKTKTPTLDKMRWDLSRKFSLDVTADGAVFVRSRGARLRSGAMPVFSTDTREQATGLQVRHCRLSYDKTRSGAGIYRLNEVPVDFDALAGVSDMMRASYEEMLIAVRGGR
jgi:hypothetical protein